MSVSKQGVINWFKDFTKAPEMVLVEDSFSEYARHVCICQTAIQLLPHRFYNLQTDEGVLQLEYYQCNLCGKVMLNRNFM